MGERLEGSDVPANVRSLGVASDHLLSIEEQEFTIVGPKDSEQCHVASEISTVTKWLQSIHESEFQWVRLNDDGKIVACKATVPKGVLKLQASARKSNTHSQMVSYGDARGTDSDREVAVTDD